MRIVGATCFQRSCKRSAVKTAPMGSLASLATFGVRSVNKVTYRDKCLWRCSKCNEEIHGVDVERIVMLLSRKHEIKCPRCGTVDAPGAVRLYQSMLLSISRRARTYLFGAREPSNGPAPSWFRGIAVDYDSVVGIRI